MLGRVVEVEVVMGGGMAAAAGTDSLGGEPADSAPAEQTKGWNKKLIRAEEAFLYEEILKIIVFF